MVRFKYRYLLVEASRRAGSEPVSKETLHDAIKNSISENFGDYGSGLLLPTYQVKYWNPDTGVGIVRIARDHFRLLWSALTLIVAIGGEYGTLRVVHVGGSMRLCYKSGVQYGITELEVASTIS